MPTHHTSSSVDKSKLQRALAIADQIEKLEAEYHAILGGGNAPARPAGRPSASRSAAAAKPAGKRGGKRIVSAEAREKMAAAQRARWARYRRAKGK